MRSLNNYVTRGIVVVAGVVLLAASSFAASLGVAQIEGGGKYLVDDKGMALYLFTKDTSNKSVCGAANGCIEKWPVFFADTPAAGKGIDAAAVGTITRDDGLKQTTYKGQPLYYFFKDKTPGDMNGDGINGVWHLVTP